MIEGGEMHGMIPNPKIVLMPIEVPAEHRHSAR